MGMHFDFLPPEILLDIFSYLNARELAGAARAVNRHWNSVALDDFLWRPLFIKEFDALSDVQLEECETFYDEFRFLKEECASAFVEEIKDFGYEITSLKFSPSGQFFAVYVAEPVVEFLHERCLSKSLGWTKSTDAVFSPDSLKLLVSGEKADGHGEIAVFTIDEHSLEVHFLTRILSSPCDFRGTWFDNAHILSGEYKHFSNSTLALADSLSQLWLCKVAGDRYNAREDLLCPLFRFLNKGGHVCAPIVSTRVSSRFRRVIQLSDLARQEGKTLSQKLEELEIDASIDTSQSMEPLRNVLDQEKLCFKCYLRHQLTDEEYDCACICHDVQERLLIFVNGENQRRVAFKLIHPSWIEKQMKARADGSFVSRKTDADSTATDEDEDDDEEEEGDDVQDSWEYVMSRFDRIDHNLLFDGPIQSLELSPDEKYLHVNVLTMESDVNGNRQFQTEMRVVDLDTMTLEHKFFYWQYAPSSLGCSTSASFLLCGTNEGAQLWSRVHRGKPLATLAHPPTPGSCTQVTLSPNSGLALTAAAMTLRVWRKPGYLREDHQLLLQPP